ncbi:MMPL family transporter [Chloroflexota bacterium]
MTMDLTKTLANKSGKRPKTVIGIWAIVFVVSLVLIGSMLGDAMSTEESSSLNPESVKANDLLAERINQDRAEETSEMIVVRSSAYTVDSPTFREYAENIYTQVMNLGEEIVLSGANYYETQDESLVSEDRHSMIIPLMLTENEENIIAPIHNIVDESNTGVAFEVLITGDATMKSDSIALADEVLLTGESIGIMVALVILAVVFGALASALLPIFLAIVAVVVSLGLTALLGQTLDLFFFVQNMITMMGLAVGIDYSLFILSRYREERERGLDKIDAITIAGATSSRAVLFSGMTVVLALVGLVIFPLNIFWSAGLGAMLVVIVAVLASLTLLPAVLGLFGDKVNKFRLPSIHRRKAGAVANSDTGFWAVTTRMVMRRPALSFLLAVGLLLAITVPYLDINKGMAGISALPDDLKSKQGYIALQEDFGFGQDAPAVVVVDGQTDSTAVQAGIASLTSIVETNDAFASSWVETYPEANLTVFYARISGDPLSKQAMDAVTELRNEYVPQSFADVPAEIMVTGQTAGMLDFNGITDDYTPIVFAMVLGLSFILLTVAFRSIVIPVTSILMNLLSVGAAYGMIVLVFQKGVGASLFGFHQVDVVESWLPLFLFAILFGLSMDYHVFLLSRVKERYMETGKNSESVAFGLRSTGKLITGAALIMVAVFGGFALGDMAMFQQMGFGLAIAVLMDATIVRSILVPATMRILGKWNWYFPTWLEWIPNVSIGEGGNEEAPATGSTKPRPTGSLTPASALITVQAEPMRFHHREDNTGEDQWK